MPHPREENRAREIISPRHDPRKAKEGATGGFRASPKWEDRGILATTIGVLGSRIPLDNRRRKTAWSARTEARSFCRLSVIRQPTMDERDYRTSDSDSPTMPGTGSFGDHGAAAAAQTPPPPSNVPVSDAPTLPHGTIPKGSSPVPISGSQYTATPASIAAFVALQPGFVFAGRYEILRVLGQGGMGAVYQ